MQNQPWKHHYIPVFYSKRWADPATGLVYRYRKFGDKVDELRVKPAACGWAPNLYAMPGVPPSEKQWLEVQYWKRLDNAAAIVLDRMLADFRPNLQMSGEDAGTWLAFVLSLLNRTPSALAAIKQFGEKTVRNILSREGARYGELRGKSDPDTLEEFLELRADELAHQLSLRGMPGMLASERIAGVVGSAPWGVFRVPPGQPSLLLSDSPIARTNGFLVDGGHLALPLSPRFLMVMARDRATANHLSTIPMREIVRAMNRETVTRAREFVVSDSPAQATFIRRHFGNADEPIHLFRAS